MTGATWEWLEALLDLLFERFDDAGARALLRDPALRRAALGQLSDHLAAAGAPADLADSAHGDNLVMAVLALRVKFPRDEARAKVRRNIAMRSGGG